MKKTEKILKEILKKVEPSEDDLKYIKDYANIFSRNIKKNLKKYKIDAEIFIGGSFAKGTVIKKDNYDVDIFIRYDKKYKNEEISILTKKALGKSKDVFVIHGSRDYFRINYEKNFFIELIPVKKINNPKEHENITDLSYLHVRYINKKIKSKKILDEIKIAKAFCYANGCYGAESYIHGFSGYSLEL
ncbi:MAG: nucleotidyltransferase domain-containing protein, partial [Nanoarchaeota archaeon]